MSPYLAYFIGLLTVVIIIILFALIARTSPPVRQVYNSIFCVTTPVGDTTVTASNLPGTPPSTTG